MEKSITQPSLNFSSSTEENVVNVQPFDRQEHKPGLPKQKVTAARKKDSSIINQKPASVRGRKSLKDIGLDADLIQVPPDDILFKKQYYAIGEVATMFRVNQSLIRHWETEFNILQPKKNRKGDRFFRPQDIKNLLLIYDLLRRRKFTIEGAKEYLKQNNRAEEKFEVIQSLQKLKAFFLELKASL
jgi:DNA-binding transcriptional MerR regulator